MVTYSSTESLTQFMHLLGSVPDKDSTTTKEDVGTGDGTTLVFFLANLGILEDTYTISYGAVETSVTDLTETTHYTLDLDTSELTLTTAGRTAVASNNIYAVYKFNKAGVANSDMTLALNAAEAKIARDTHVTFADQTVAAPGYIKIENESIKGHYDPYDKVYDVGHPPIIKLQTTTNGAFTLGETTLTLTSGSGFPSSGTIYVDGNKVAYTAKSTHNLTVPNTTPSIDDDSTVRGEVVELSMEPEGTAPDYEVLDPDTEYEIDYDNGRIKVLASGYWGEISSDDRIYPSNYLLRLNYMHAWHDLGRDAEIPGDIEWAVNALAARKMMGSVVAKANELGLDGFSPSLINVDREEIKETIENYQTLNVGSSMYNKQSLT